MNALIKRLVTPVLVAALFVAPSTALSFGNSYLSSVYKRDTILEVLQKTDGMQALVAAVVYVDTELGTNIAAQLDDRNARQTLFAPPNASFAVLLGQPADALDGVEFFDVLTLLPDLLAGAGVSDEKLAAILQNHLAVRGKYSRRGTEDRLLKNGEVEVINGEKFPVGIGGSGVQINYESTITKADLLTRNGEIQYVDNVILNGLLNP